MADDASILRVIAVVEPPVSMMALGESFLVTVAEDLVKVNGLRILTGKQRQGCDCPLKPYGTLHRHTYM